MAKGCVYIPKTGKDAGKVFGSKESLAAHMNYTPALTDLMSKFQQSGGKADIDSVTKWLGDNGYLKEKPKGKPGRRERLAKLFEEPKVEVAPTEEAGVEAAPEMTPEEVRINMKPITDEMASIEMEFANNGYSIDWDYDNEIIITDKDGKIVDAEELPGKLLPLAAQYEKATAGLAEYDYDSYRKALDQSRKDVGGIETEFEEVKPLAITEKTETQQLTLKDGRKISPTKINGKTTFFHASSKKRKGRLRANTAPQWGKAVYFAGSRKGATDEFGEDNVTEVNLDLKKPLYTNSKEFQAVEKKAAELYNKAMLPKIRQREAEFVNGEWKFFNEDFQPQYDKNGYVDFYSADDIEEGKYFGEAAQELGYDAIIDQGGQYGTEIAVLDESAIIYPEDVKTALEASQAVSDRDVISVTNYNEKAKKLAHAVKDGDADAIDAMAKEMAAKVPENAVLIPMPSRSGKATNMKDLAEAISKISGAPVADVLTGKKRKSLYEAKKKGETISADDLKMQLTGELPKGKIPIIIDNVLATGATFKAAKEAIPNAKIIVHSVDQIKAGVSSVESKPFEAVLWHEGYGEKTKGDAVYLESEEASKAASGKGKPYKVKLNNPYIVEKDGDFDLIKGFINEFTENNPQSKWHPDTTKYVNDKLRRLGYDGLVIKQSAIDTDKGYEDIESTYGNAQVVAFNKNAVSPVEQVEAEKPQAAQMELQMPERVVVEKNNENINSLIAKKSRYNSLPKTKKAIGANLLEKIKREAADMGFSVITTSGLNIKIVDAQTRKPISKRGVSRTSNKEYIQKKREAQSLAETGQLGLRASILNYFIGGKKIKSSQSELGEGSAEIKSAERKGLVSASAESIDGVAGDIISNIYGDIENAPEGMEDEVIAELQDVLATHEDRVSMEEELFDLYEKLIKDQEEAARYNTAEDADSAMDEGLLDEDSLVEYYETQSQINKLTENEQEKLYRELYPEAFEQEAEGTSGMGNVEGSTREGRGAEKSKSKRLQRAEELRAKAQDLRDASGGTLMAGPKLLAAAYEAYATILETTESIIEAIKKFKGTKEYKDLDVNGKKELDVVLATDAVEEEISSGRDPQEAVDDLIGSQDWYGDLSNAQKEQLNEILQDDFGVTVSEPKQMTPLGKQISSIVDNYYKLKDGDRSAKDAINEILDADPKLKYIYDNIRKINKQLQEAGVITDKTDGCP